MGVELVSPVMEKSKADKLGLADFCVHRNRPHQVLPPPRAHSAGLKEKKEPVYSRFLF